MTEAELAWVAGLLEGEGCFTIANQRQWSRHYRYPVIACTMTDLDVIQRLHKLVGMGRVGGPYGRAVRNGTPRKPQWKWQLQRRDQAAMLMRTLLPLMGERRANRIRYVLFMTGY